MYHSSLCFPFLSASIVLFIHVRTPSLSSRFNSNVFVLVIPVLSHVTLSFVCAETCKVEDVSVSDGNSACNFELNDHFFLYRLYSMFLLSSSIWHALEKVHLLAKSVLIVIS